MAFPYRPSVHDDLRDLFGIHRIESTTNDLGYSSITVGEGSLDLLGVDGEVLGRFGDQPDGRFGLGLAHRGTFANVSDLIGAGEDRDDAQDGRMDGHESRLGSAEGRLDGHDSTLASHNTRIGNAQSRADDAHADAATAQSRADSAWTRAGTGIANAATAQARADSAHDRIDGLNYASPGDIATLSNQIQALRSEVHDWMNEARASNPSLPPPIPN